MSQTTRKTARLVQYALLMALLAVLGFTPLGFIMVPPVSITILHIPVILGAVLFGPGCGALLGLEFGLISMVRAIMAPTPPIDMLVSPAASGAPVQAIVLCILPRVLLGVIAGALFLALKKLLRKDSLAAGISAAAAAVCHTVGVLGCLWFFFKALPLRQVFLAIVGVNGLLELAAAILLTALICPPLRKFLKSGR